MRFLLCTAFWLGLVFAHMDWRDDALSSTVADTKAIAAKAADGAQKLCASHARACLDAVARAGAANLPKPAPRG
jgi:hypothetical protein